MEIFGPNRNKLLTFAISLLLVVGMVISIFTPNFFIFTWWSKFIMQIAVGYWAIGLGFLFLKQQRLTMVSFACCVVLCLYLKGTTNSRLDPVKVTNEPKFSIAHFNLSESPRDYGDVASIIKQTNADIISLQEVTPDWNVILKDSFNQAYPFSCQVSGVDLHSSKIYSKYKYTYCDTFYSEGVPNLVIGFPNGYNTDLVYVVSSFIEPPIYNQAYEMMKSQFDAIGTYVRNLNSPAIALGDYNIPATSFDIQKFREIAKLFDSRRGYRPDRNDGRINFLEVPIDHIFYTGHFDCIEFQTIIGKNATRLGIKGLYQFNKDSMTYTPTPNHIPKIGLQTTH